MVGERFTANAPYYENLGISLDSGTFTIKGADGRDLSSSNPGIVVLQSKSNPGQLVRYEITANQSFEDATSASGSDIVGNTFGTTASTAWAEDIPFFLYAISNDSENDIVFSISRLRDMKLSPTAANLGDSSSPSADAQFSHFLFKDVTLTEYDENPCVCLGYIEMTKDASDDNTVNALTDEMGIGRFPDYTQYVFPAGQNGATSGKYLQDSSGTAPVFSTNQYRYIMKPGGYVEVQIKLSGDGGTDGVGAVNANLRLPLQMALIGGANPVTGNFAVNSSVTGNQFVMFEVGTLGPGTTLYEAINTFVQLGDFGSGGKTIQGHLIYLIKSS